MQWLLTSTRKTFQAYVLIVLKNSKELSLQLKGHIESCFIWLEFMPSDHFSDEFFVDDFCLPATIYAPHDSNSSTYLTTPTKSFQRLLDALCSIKKDSYLISKNLSLGSY